MGDNVIRKLREGGPPPSTQPYSFQGDTSKPRESYTPPPPPPSFSRPTTTNPPQSFSRPVQQTSNFGRPSGGTTDRTYDGDRHYAYTPPVVREDGSIQEWNRPTVGQILADLGLRLLERAIVGLAVYATEELVYFFQKRRFVTKNPPQYRG